jgi:hypothetical protein
MTEVQNHYQKRDFIQNPNILLSQITEKLSMAGGKFTNQYELSRSQTFEILGMYAYVDICLHVLSCIYIYYIYIHMYIYMYIYFEVYVCTYSNTYTFTYMCMI